MNVGDRCKITKRTFLHTGIFVHTGSLVTVKSVEGDRIVAEYTDKEGYPHDIEFQSSELELT